ncbi:GatB/YqeY domain-containing protein [Pelagibacterales bacterium]|jgi:uncharacterized protein YqeY|nr:GatB/YqeY domain-containing protein [Pelagibacterales bacterium]MBL6861479.1 GatB/YqeY domain-containing protein [Pelagibacterales bacterium]MDB9818328.1 GatB/YqeY domain-containing protein [Pelagibacterales bacterium]MDB9985869.1 GatB/YqeY domain-containing protein [Pelagibacterales bacterium]|tara:strand:+ start:7638 stop:8093 length:456 start_codon:yes stop_codon:yes gene_type:complete
MKNLIIDKLGEAQKAADKSRILTLRLIIAAIKDKEIASRSNGENDEIGDETIVSLLRKMIKQRQDSIEMFTKASRQELVDKESLEIDIINEFLPSQLDEEQTKEACKIAIKDLEVDSIKAMGKVVKYLKDQHGGSVDMSLASKIIKEILQN